MSGKENLKSLIAKHSHHLQKLKEQQASFGLHTPAHILTEIDDVEAEIEKLKTELAEIEDKGLPSENAPPNAQPGVDNEVELSLQTTTITSNTYKKSQETGSLMSGTIMWGLFGNLLAALISIVTTILIRVGIEDKLSIEDVYVALGIFFPFLLTLLYYYRKSLVERRIPTKSTPSYFPQPFRPSSLGINFLWIALPTFSLPILFYLITGRNVLFTGLLFSEMALPPPDIINQVFNMKTGELLVDESPLLQISGIRYEYANGSQELLEITVSNKQMLEVLPVESGKEGRKIRLEHLFDEGKLQEENILAVPFKIQLVVDHLQRSDNLILVYVLTDEVYLQQPTLQILPLRRTKIYRDIYIGQPGILNFIDLNDYSVTLPDNPNIILPGVGPIAALFVVEFEENKPILRSNIVFIKRKGIMHPDDIWFTQDEKREPFITFPLNKSGDRMFAFQSPESDTDVNDIFISRLDGSGIMNIAPSFFLGSEEVICGWGDDDGNYNTLYFLSSKEGGNAKAPYKVVFSNETISQPFRLTNFPQRCTKLQ